MPPVNNNFANATNIGGTSDGFIQGDNIGATVEASEPTNEGKTVWYKWNFSGAIKIWFGTRFNFHRASENPQTDFPTRIAVYTGTALNNLVLVTSAGPWGGWEYGSMVTFNALASTDYYIRVDGRSGAEGHFLLWWEAQVFRELGDCDMCHPHPNRGEVCLGLRTPDTELEADTVTWGNRAAGTYRVAYCKGAFREGVPQGYGLFGVARMMANHELINGSDHFTFVHYQSNGSPAVATFPEARPAGWGYASQDEAEKTCRCMETKFAHSGGDITLEFNDEEPDDPIQNDNVSGNPDPTYALYRMTPVLLAAGTSSSFKLSNPSTYRTIFLIQNATGAPVNGVTLTLQTSANVSNPSAPQTVNFATGELKGVQFDYDVSPTGETNFQVAIRPTNGTDPMPDLVYQMTPILDVTLLSVLPGASCAGSVSRVILRFQNNGNGPTYALTADLVASAPVTQIKDIFCAPQTNFPVGNGEIGPTTHQDLTVYVVPSGASGTLTVTPKDGTLTHPSVVINF